jgi:hypothetical protein
MWDDELTCGTQGQVKVLMDINQKAKEQKIPLKIPRLILSAAAGYLEIHGTQRRPRLHCISESDERAKKSPWYQSPSRTPSPVAIKGKYLVT